MNKIFLIGIVLVLLAFDLAALHDITSGEPDVYGEYGILLFSAIIFGAIIYYWIKQRRKHENSHQEPPAAAE